MKNNQAFDILSKIIQNTVLSKEEQELIEEWRKKSHTNQQIYLFATTQVSVDSLPENMIEYKAIYERIKNNINPSKSQPEKTTAEIHKISPFNRIWKYAAVFALGIVSTMTVMQLVSPDSSPALSEITVPKGSISEVMLPDSSVVIINSSSKLSYSNDFLSEKRIVNLEGEAFFKVRKQINGNEFAVCSKGTQIVVKGTEFNVRAYQEDPTVEATLVKGAIVFCADKKSIPLKPEQRLVYNTANKEMVVQKTNLEDTGWRNGLYTFKDISLKEVIEILNRIYNANIVINEASQDIVFSGCIDRANSLKHSLDVITLATGTHFQTINDTIYLKK